MKGAELFVKCLEKENCKVIFGLPGEEILELMEAIRSSSIKFFLTRHEITAGLAASAYGRMTLTPGVCLATLGPGAVNLAPGVADAFLDRVPMLAVTGQTETSKLGMWRHQLIDSEQLFRPITKWTITLGSADMIPEKVKKAYRVAKSIPMGPAHLDYPSDVQMQSTEKTPLPEETRWIVKEPVSPKGLNEIAERISRAKAPVIVTGLSCVRRSHHESLRKFAEAYGIPVVATPLSKGVLPAGHELSFGVIAPLCSKVTLELINQSDLVITVGYDFIEVDTKFWLKKDVEIIHIDYVPSDVDEAYNARTEILGNIGVNLDALAKLARQRAKSSEILEYKMRLAKDLSAGADSSAFPVKPQRLIKDLREAVEKNAIICVDTGAVKYLMTRYWRVCVRRTFFLSNGLATMGFAVPAAIAASLVFPERQILAVVGDGGFQMSLSDLRTIAENNLDITMVIFDNSGYGAIAGKQVMAGKPVFCANFTNPDFCKIAEASGIKAYSVKKASEAAAVIREALSDGKPSLVHVPVERSEVEIMKESAQHRNMV